MKFTKIKFLSISVVSTLPLFSLTSCFTVSNTQSFKAKALPSVKEYDHISSTKYKINGDTRFCITKAMWDDTQNKIRDFFYNAASDYYLKMQDYSHPLHETIPIITMDANFIPRAGDIVFKYLDTFEKYAWITSKEAYQINIKKYIEISELKNTNSFLGFLWATRTLLQMQLSNNGINYGLITDWPKIDERGIYFDFSGRGYTIDFVDKLIRECSWNKLNTIGLRFASGGVHINTHRESFDKSHDGTWFHCDWDNYSTTAIRPIAIEDDYDICTNYADPMTPWDWNGKHSEFGELLSLAKLNGITLLPEMNVFSHAWFITDLTCPKNSDGSRKSDIDITPAEREWDFACYDNNGKRLKDAVDLAGDKIGSKVAMDLIENIVSYYANLFKAEGINTFSIGGDEYIENFRWQNMQLTINEKQKIVDSYYDFTHRLDYMLMNKGLNTQQWNDDIFRNIRNQDLNDDFGFPPTSQDNSDSIIRSQQNLIKQIKYWWKGDAGDMNPLASIDDFINGTNGLGGGIKSIINYDYWNLYFCDDTNGTRVPSAKNLYQNWHPGIFSKDHEKPGSPYQTYYDNENHNLYPSWIGGAMMSCWWDYAPYTMSTIYGPLKSFAQKSWNGTNKNINYYNFEKIIILLGHGPGI